MLRQHNVVNTVRKLSLAMRWKKQWMLQLFAFNNVWYYNSI